MALEPRCGRAEWVVAVFITAFHQDIDEDDEEDDDDDDDEQDESYVPAEKCAKKCLASAEAMVPKAEKRLLEHAKKLLQASVSSSAP